MTSISTTKGLLVVLPILMLSVPFAYAEAVSIHVLSYSESKAYQKIIKGFTQSIEEGNIVGEALVLPNPDERGTSEANLVFALGDKAAKQAVTSYSGKPLVVTMLNHPELLPNKANIAGILLDFPIEIELKWIKKAFPKHRDLGVIYSPDTHATKVGKARKIAKSMGFRFHAIPVSRLSDLPDALNVLGKKSDIMWGMPDLKLLNARTARLILSFTLKNNMPFIGPSEAWVNAGATFSLVRNYEDIGKQCALLAKSLLEGESNKGLYFQAPRKLSYVINAKQAKHLKIKFSKGIIDSAMVINP